MRRPTASALPEETNMKTAVPMDSDELRSRAGFKSMAEGTLSDWNILGAEFVRFASDLPDRVLAHLALLADGHAGFPVDRLTHSLQAATLAYEDGRDEEYVACALLHDIGDSLGTYNHPDIAAAILQPFVSERNHWMVQKHGMFQMQHMLRDTHGGCGDVLDGLRSHPYFAYAEEFAVRYDSPAFDPERPIQPLAFFEPAVRRLFAGPRQTR
jgi:predicted HD phosphohydrolase